MKRMPHSKVIIFSSVLIIIAAIATIIPVSFCIENKKVVTLDKKSFESYFNIETSYTSLNGMLQVNYKVYPQNKEIIKNEKSSDRIMLTVTISFYKGYNASGFFLDSENIQIILQKSKGYSVNGVKSISVPTKAQSYKLYVSKAIGSICE